MISHSHKFIFILPCKTASTSLITILLNYCRIKELIEQKQFNSFDFFELDNDFDLNSWKKFTSNKNHPRKHAPLSSYHELNVINYNLFAVIRNPYDRIISLWKWETESHQKFHNLSFKKWLDIKQFWWHRPQYDFIYSDHIDIHRVNLIRFEDIQNDFDIACGKIGIPRQELPHKNATKHKHYTEYYDDETREIVAKRHKKDIEYFGYKFGE